MIYLDNIHLKLSNIAIEYHLDDFENFPKNENCGYCYYYNFQNELSRTMKPGNVTTFVKRTSD